MKKILIPIDFAESSVRAIQYAAEVFSKQQVEIHLIHVATAKEEQVTKIFAAFEAEHLKPTRIPYTFTLLNGDVLPQIQNAINSMKPDVVIIGLNDGSLSKAFLKLTDCPVILIPKTSSQHTIKNIAYANDFKNIKESSPFGLLLSFSHTFGADIHIIHVSKDRSLHPDEAEKAIEYYLNSVKHEYSSITSDDFVAAIQKYVGDKNIDLLTLLLRDHGINELPTRGELVEQLVNKSNVPILSLI